MNLQRSRSAYMHLTTGVLHYNLPTMLGSGGDPSSADVVEGSVLKAKKKNGFTEMTR